MGEDKLVGLFQENLAVATWVGAVKPADFRQVVIDTTVQEKAIAFPTTCQADASRTRAPARLAQARGVTLRQSYVRVGKIALIRHQRYAHAKQFKRATRALRSIRTMLGRVIRYITRKIVGRPELADVFALPLSRARRVKDQRQPTVIGALLAHAPRSSAEGGEGGEGAPAALPYLRAKLAHIVSHETILSPSTWMAYVGESRERSMGTEPFVHPTRRHIIVIGPPTASSSRST